MHYKTIALLVYALLLLISPLQANNTHLDQYVSQQLTKHIDVTQPKQEDSDLLFYLNQKNSLYNANHNNISLENMHAISSVNFISDIVPQYIKTKTLIGHMQAAYIAANITDDIDILTTRQTMLTYLYDNSELLTTLQSLLDSAKIGEDELLTILNPTDNNIIEYQKELKTNPLAHDAILGNKYINESIARPIQALVATYPISMIQQAYKNYNIYGPLFCCAAEFGALYIIKRIFDNIHHMQQKLMNISKIVRSMQQINCIIAQHPEIHCALRPEVDLLHDLFNNKSTQTSAQLKYIIQELSSSFKGEQSYWLSFHGKIIATNYYLNKYAHELIPYLQALGTIDAYISAAQLYSTFKQHPYVRFCLPTFVESKTPILNIEKYWHPLIDPNVVVTNDLAMGNNIKNLMITGPNAGGKTTSLMSLIINIIFAQSFGIAPSASLSMTPFAKIHSYLDITTNLQEGLSLFAAEVDRAKKLKQSINSCTYGQKTFTIIDEIFSGTNPTVASDIGFKFAAQLGEIPHSMTIITTHFPRLTDIEKECKTFINYKVADATIMPSGKIIYPFKLIPGISSQNVAQHMLEQADII